MKSKEGDGTFGEESQQYKIHFHLDNNIVYLIITHKKFSRFAFLFLKDLNEKFIDWLKSKFETKDIYSKLQKITEKNMFSDFNLINEIKDYWEYRINRNNIEKLNREIINVNKIMMKNIDSLLERDGYLNEIDSLSKSVMSSSRNFEKTAMDIRIKTQKK